MRKTQNTLAAAVFAAVFSIGGSVSAADLYTGGGLKDVPVYAPLWTGFYLGGHMGIAWTEVNLPSFAVSDGYDPTTMGGGKLNSANGFGGGQFGYNWQTANWVFGIEVDLDAVVLNNRVHMVGTTGTGNTFLIDGNDNDARFAGDLTGRLGWTWGSTLIYAKGGFAWLQTNMALRETVIGPASFMCGPGGVCVGSGGNNYLTGWVVGGGLEWKVSPSWSIKAEYLHYDFTDFNTNCCGDGINTFNIGRRDLTSDTVKLGFNYYLSSAPAPLK